MRPNGPLTPSIQERLLSIRSSRNMTMRQLGAEFTLSGPFMSSLLNSAAPGNIRSKHIPRIQARLPALEEGADVSTPAPAADPGAMLPSGNNWMELLVETANARGYDVIFRKREA
jgi:hypothetical protein